ncbi:MAG: hypothetical protein WCE53_18400 [Candidatus Acidiferrum sp.]
MICVTGRVSEFLRDTNGEIKGILLDGGREIRFSVALGHLVSPIIKEGSLVGIEGEHRCDEFPGGYTQATIITDLDSGRSATLPVPIPQGKPGIWLKTSPTETVSLDHPDSQYGKEEKSANSQATSECEALNLGPSEVDSKPLHPASFFHALLRENDGQAAELTRNEAARIIGLAYDSLHRIQAILAYLHIIKHRVPGISEFLDEAKHTYEQAHARFATTDFTGAKELAEASVSLSRVVEIVMARTLRSDSSLPSLVPPPPGRLGVSLEPEHVEEDLAHAETVLSRIRWVLEHGTLPSEERAQVRKIASWGDAFYKQAQHTYRSAVLEDASEFAQAALAGAYSAEHVCRKWYVSHSSHP